jgi:hypothetical protein
MGDFGFVVLHGEASMQQMTIYSFYHARILAPIPKRDFSAQFFPWHVTP